LNGRAAMIKPPASSGEAGGFWPAREPFDTLWAQARRGHL
jgi:hypothetical protein